MYNDDCLVGDNVRYVVLNRVMYIVMHIVLYRARYLVLSCMLDWYV